MKLLKVSDQGVAEVFGTQFVNPSHVTPRTKWDKDCVLLLEGGTDISPMLYGEPPGKYTQRAAHARDAFEMDTFYDAQAAGAYCIGICRGAQLLTVLAGGSLIQDVTGHDGNNHLMDTYDKKTIPVTSTHHQMMAPGNIEHKLLGWALTNRSKHYLDGLDQDCFGKLDSCFGLEPEIVWYPKIRALAIQGHPEYQSFYSAFPSYCRDLVRRFIIERTET